VTAGTVNAYKILTQKLHKKSKDKDKGGVISKHIVTEQNG
jgi:hypothetical protein